MSLHGMCFSHFRVGYMSELRGMSFPVFQTLTSPVDLSAIHLLSQDFDRAGPNFRPCGVVKG
jgi:hypothetical protein